MTNLPVYILAVILSAVGIGLCAYKVTVLGLPLSPNEKTEVWVVETRVAFSGSGGPAKLTLDLPTQPPGFEILDEDYVSRRFGLALDETGPQRQALWSIRNARSDQVLYYRLTVRRTDRAIRSIGDLPGYPPVPDYPDVLQPAVDSLLSDVRSTSADIGSFARQLILRLNSDRDDASVHLFRGRANNPDEWAQQIVYILAGARIPARVVYGLQLSDGLLDGRLEPWIEVHNEQEWMAFDPVTGDRGFPNNFLIWTKDARQLINVEGGAMREMRMSARRNLREVISVAKQSAELRNSRALELSPLALPVHVQNVYSVLLTIPLGALLVVLLRNIVGVQTFGTFMPVLIALAFRETQLVWGLILFTLLVALGLTLRFALERMKLLLVPRLAAVLIIVILLMLGVSLTSHQLGLERGLSVALFPMVILAMTIERMSIVWDEHGGHDAVLQGIGSLAVAAAGYLVMTNDKLEHLVFVFPELLLALLALMLLLGRYTGYRLTEFWRFRAAMRDPD